MLGLGLIIPKIRLRGIAAWFAAFIKRTRADGATTFEGKKCIQADGEYLITSKRGNIIADAMGDYATTYGGEGLEARACTAQAVNNLIYSPLAQARFMFLAEDLGTDLESYYCVSNNVDALEGDLAVFGAVTDTYGSNLSNGGVTLSVKNGTAPYAYSWSNGSTAEDLAGLTKGIYSIQVKDSLGALASNSFTVRGDADPSIVTAGLRMDSYFTNSALEFPALGSAEFNGSSDFIDIPDANLPSGTSARTICGWIYPRANDNGRILSYGTATTNAAFDIITQSGTNVLAVIGHGGNYFSTTAISVNEWAFISTTLSSGVLKMYANGSEIYSTNSALINTTLSGNARIGKGTWDVNDWDGNLANFAIWNRALHPDEINAIMWKSYADLNIVDKNGLQAWYALDDINGTTVPDSTGNHNGTAN